MISALIITALSAAGVALWIRELAPLGAAHRLRNGEPESKPRTAEPERSTRPELPDLAERVAIIIPARNEAHNLPNLLPSLPAGAEIIVVDDHSHDGSADVARSHGARVISAEPVPPGWLGKPWACHQGARVATRPLLVFTDADTVFGRRLIPMAADLVERGAGLVSVVPTHRQVSAWERLQGCFQLLLLIAASVRKRSGSVGERRYAIGQFLMFRRDVYEKIGGHVAVRGRIAEDLAFARLVREHRAAYELLIAKDALMVRMYPEGVSAFIAGWRRNFREGFRSAGVRGGIEIGLVLAWLLGAPLWTVIGAVRADLASLVSGGVAWLVAILCIARSQRAVGDFPHWTAILYPLPAIAFVWASLLASLDHVRGRPTSWRGREVLIGAGTDPKIETPLIERSR